METKFSKAILNPENLRQAIDEHFSQRTSEGVVKRAEELTPRPRHLQLVATPYPSTTHIGVGRHRHPRNELISLLRQPTDSWLQYYDIYWSLVERFCDEQGTSNPSLTAWWNSELRPLRRQLRSCSEKTMRAIVIHTMTALEIYLKSIGEERSADQMKESKRRMLAGKAGRVFSARFPPTLAFLPPELSRLPRGRSLSPFLKKL